MKKALFTCTLLFICTLTYTQGYDFAPLGTTWYYSSCPLIPAVLGDPPLLVEVVAKEQYQGQFCSKLVGFRSPTMPEPCYMYAQNDFVFFYSNYSQRFELLYDFTAGIGDSWTIGGLGTTLGYDSIVVTVDSVSTMTVSGQTRKIQFISSPQFLFFDWGRTIMEGVGELSFMAPDWGLYEDGGCGLRCFNDGTNDLRFVPYPCDAIVSTPTPPDDIPSITASPNPTNGQITVNNPPPNAILRLFDALGRRINLPTITGAQIDLGHCSSGIYILEIWDGARVLERVKVVKR